MSYARNGAIGGGGSGGSEIAGSGAAGLVTLWTSTTTITGDPSGTWSGTGHTFVIGSPTFNARDGHFTGPAGASFGPSAVGGGFTNQPAGDTVTLVSDNAADNTQQVTIIGVLAGVDASENITLTDVTPVVSVGTYDLILALVLNGACAGTVTASETSGGLAITTIAPAALSAGLQTFAAIDGYGKVLQIVASGATTKTVGIGGYALGGGIQREPVVLTGTTKVNTTATWEGAVQFYLGDLENTVTVTLNSIAGFDFKSVAGVFEPVEAGSLAASNLTPGQVLLASAATGSTGATSITGDSGCTWAGTGSSFVQTIATGANAIVLGGAAGLFGTTFGANYLNYGTRLNTSGQHVWVNSANVVTGTPDLALSRASAGALLVEDGSGNARDVQARTVFASTLDRGADSPLYVAVTGGSGWYFGGSGVSYALFPGNDNLSDIGLSASYRLRTGYFGTSLYSPLFSGGAPATGTNIAGTTTTVAGQLGTGTGASGDQVFTVGTPQASGTTQHVAATALTLHNAGTAGTAAPQAIFADGTAAAPAMAFTGDPTTGWYRRGGSLMTLAIGGAIGLEYAGGSVQSLRLGTALAAGFTVSGSSDIQLGDPNSATPASRVFQGEGSRAGTDTNVAGGNLTIRPGAGTGSATGSSLIFQTPTAGASGTAAQTQTTRLTITEGQALFEDGTAAKPAISFASGPTTGFNTISAGTYLEATLGGVSNTYWSSGGFNLRAGLAVKFDGSASQMSGATVRLAAYTVATLPAGTVGDTAYVTDATAPTYLGALTGGGAVVTPVFYNGAAWVSH